MQGSNRSMLEADLQILKAAFQSRQKPMKWTRDDLHPMDLKDSSVFIQNIEAGADRAALFQSAIPYFDFLTNDARIFLLPDFLATLISYPHHIFSVPCHFEDQRGRELLASLTLNEKAAVRQFVDGLSDWNEMRPYSDLVKELRNLVSV